MNWEQLKGKWNEMSGKVKEEWGDLTDDDITEAAGQREQLAAKVQQRCGKTKEQAEKEVDDWANRIS